ncbi:hypothetical protein GCM10011584_09440 [Nocardioides phosphati]|uniref:Uncharacterized protein n=1 Tax=Nocardioides phosphati TaxID=1867775 RepID=A0ABQ2N9F9_9ACTN|nr:hypothetical protein [Nocardioides phosphati]GGO86640.1 hypothetical protein GCM10011584_09440 [Nocardioides phosphati]
MSKTDVLDLAGLCLLALFGFAIWPPLCLAVFGAGMLLASRELARGDQ